MGHLDMSKDEGGIGDCYSAAVNAMMALTENGTLRATMHCRLVHGWPTGQGDIAGIKYGHAWVEIDTSVAVLVIDNSNGRSVAMPKEDYYRIGNIDESEATYYTFEEMAKLLLKSEHYGPWVEKPEDAV